VFDEFIIWRDTHGFHIDINIQRFGMCLNNIATKCISKGKHTMFGDKKKMNITMLKLKYNIPT
jgi:hypothetical protein